MTAHVPDNPYPIVWAAPVIVGSVKSVGGHVHIRIERRHAFRSVPRVGVVPGSIPKQQTRRDVLHLVFSEKSRIPAGTLHIELPSVYGCRADIHTAISRVESETEGIQYSQFGSDAAKPCVPVGIVRQGHDGGRSKLGQEARRCHF